MNIIAPAKLNLYLHITGRRDDGYHLLESIFVFTTFGDEITITPASTLSVTIDGPFCASLASESPEGNLAYRAAALLQKKYAVDQGAHIHITKNIPVGAGLGGGSSDAAAVLKGLNQLWHINCDDQSLAALGFSLGADIPACVIQKPVFVSGIGEIIKPIDLSLASSVLLVNPNHYLSTPAVFQQYKKNNSGFTKGMEGMPGTTYPLPFSNDLESAAIQLLPDIQVILDTLKKQTGCTLARMSGSGATCFALFQDAASMRTAEKNIRKIFPMYWVQCTTV